MKMRLRACARTLVWLNAFAGELKGFPALQD
jgi:hypothetical protein